MSIKFMKLEDGYDKGNCPVMTVQLNGFSPDKIINSMDYSNDIYENSSFYTKTIELEALYPSGDINMSVSGFLIEYYETHPYFNNDILVTDKLNKKGEPLYYSYEPKFDIYSIVDEGVVEVYKNNNVKLSDNKFNIEFGYPTLTDNYYDTNDETLDRYGSGIIWGDFDDTKTIHRIRVLLPLEVYERNTFYTVRYLKSIYNISFENHIELVELESLYDNTDFIVDNDEIKLTDESKIPNGSIESLFIIKDPNKRIVNNGILNIGDVSYQNDADTSWSLRINNGNFLKHGDKNANNKKYFQIDYVEPVDDDSDKYQSATYIKPKIVSSNIVKVDEAPIYVSGYIYPEYNIDIFPKTTLETIIPTGTFGIDIDGVNVDQLKISSIDRNKGYILFNKQISPQKDIDMFFYTDGNYQTHIRNLELNPRISGDYGFSNGSSTVFKNIGIATRMSPNGGIADIYDENIKYKRPYFFDFDNIENDTITFYRGNTVPGQTTTSVQGKLIYNPYSTNGVDSNNGRFAPIAHLAVNKLTPDILNINDARVIGGGYDKTKSKKISNTEFNSFTDIGYYDGEPLPHAGLIVIHIPSGIYPALIQRWEDSNIFNSDLYSDLTKEEINELIDITTDENLLDYYNKLLQGYSTTDDTITDPYGKMLNKWAKKEASHYLDQLIKKYIHAGTQYILMDNEFNYIKLDL